MSAVDVETMRRATVSLLVATALAAGSAGAAAASPVSSDVAGAGACDFDVTMLAHGVPVPDVVDMAVTPDEGSIVWVGETGRIHVLEPHPDWTGAPADRGDAGTAWVRNAAHDPDLIRTDDTDTDDDAEALRRGEEVVTGIDLTPSGLGAWVFTSYGRVFPYGDADWFGDLGSLGVEPVDPVIGGTATTAGDGYWMFAADGGLFTFGAAGFFDSLPGVLPPGAQLGGAIVGMVPADDDRGYLMVGSDGGMFAFGSADFHGSLPGLDVVPVAPVVDMMASPGGYLQVASDGGTFLFGAAAYVGSIPGAISCGKMSQLEGVGEVYRSRWPIVSAAVLASNDGYVLTDDHGFTWAFGSATALPRPRS